MELRASGIQFREGQVFQLLAHVLHADAARPAARRCPPFPGRCGGACPALSMIAQGAHVVQPVGQLHQQHADVAGDGQHQLAEILRLLGALGENFQLGELGDAVHQTGDLLAEILLDVLIGDQRVLDRVVQQRGHDGGHVELELGEDGGDFQRMGEIGIARGAELLAMRGHGIDIGLVEQRLVGVRVIGRAPARPGRSGASAGGGRAWAQAVATAAAFQPVRWGRRAHAPNIGSCRQSETAEAHIGGIRRFSSRYSRNRTLAARQARGVRRSKVHRTVDR